ncbi:hypothetical protein [Neorhodopirellula pilleata]|uniref:Uncharacterized protein n=1 Tax=Neorhodopirellula pilleata TaxID=2714738 RepID=A0A5C5ZM32_9BACT|nr:hypothetical protein [Neorhodopirellula pilleata]TWT88037.1 hypothetical protein Pla100_57680 [Neorhodopirellula pilleata]
MHDHELEIANSTAAGREALALRLRILQSLTPEQKLMKSFELTELTRQTMRAGIRRDHPDATQPELDWLCADRLLQFQKLCPEIRQEVLRRRQAMRPQSAIATE